MVQAMDHGASDRLESTSRSDGLESKRWIWEQSMDRQVSDGSELN